MFPPYLVGAHGLHASSAQGTPHKPKDQATATVRPFLPATRSLVIKTALNSVPLSFQGVSAHTPRPCLKPLQVPPVRSTGLPLGRGPMLAGSLSLERTGGKSSGLRMLEPQRDCGDICLVPWGWDKAFLPSLQPGRC